MSEMTAMPSLTSALMPASAPVLRPVSTADAGAGNAANAAGAADDKDPGPDAVVAQGTDVSPFAAIMKRHQAQAAAKTDAAPAKKAAAADDIAPDPAVDLSALLPLIQSLVPNAAAQSATIAEQAVTTATPSAVSVTDLSAAPVADLAAAPVKKAAAADDIAPDPAASSSLAAVMPLIQALAPSTAGQSGTGAEQAVTVAAATPGTAPVADPAAAPVRKAAAAEGMAPDPADYALAAVLPMIQSLLPNKAGQPELGAVSEKRQAVAPSAPQLLEGATAIQANMASGSAATEPFTAAASDKAAITAALSAPTGDAMTTHARQTEAAAPEGTFQNLLAAAQVPTQTHPGDARASAPLHVETPVGASGWNDNVGEKLVWMVGRQEQRAELVLNPPQLGRVEVSLSMNGDQANAQFVSANPAVREALEAAMPRLREMLADAGVSLGQTHVGSESANNAANQSANRQENRDNPSRGSQGLGALRQMNVSAPWLRQGNGMVDVFA